MDEMQNENLEKSEKGQNAWLWKVLLIICSIGAIIAIGSIINGAVKNRHEQQLLEELADQTVPESSLPESESPAPIPLETPEPEPEKEWDQLTLEEKIQKLEEYFGIDIPDKNIDFAALQEETNADIYAWIYIPNTKIDYPVLQHPEDNLYYLNYNIDGTKGYPGCIYTEDYNSKDFTDHNTVIYGHNMKNGTMFAGLHKYEDSKFFEENPYVYIYTADEVYVYQVFAAYEFSDAHILYNYPSDTDAAFSSYLEEVMDVRSMNSNFNSDIEVAGTDKIVTLSTCISNKPNNRYLVQGLLLEIDE